VRLAEKTELAEQRSIGLNSPSVGMTAECDTAIWF